MAFNIDLNKANENDLTSIPGISKDRAQSILKWRNEHGNFNSWDDVKKVPGFSETLIEALKRGGAGFGGRKAA